MYSNNVTDAEFNQLFRLCETLESMSQTATNGEVSVRPGMANDDRNASNVIIQFLDSLTDEKVMEIHALMTIGEGMCETNYKLALGDARAEFSEFSRSQISKKNIYLRGYIENGLRMRHEQGGR
ncbi:MAG: hypothetical protein WA071_14865 [Undibacterium umbellatum]|uniref:hypothetical protein n=1 Tax=Undibacterium umbellatum TaxID=2762300 RepID=UPI003BB4D627